MAAAQKASQGEVTQAALLDWAAGPKLVDIGLNLADSSFDQVLLHAITDQCHSV